MKPVYQADHVTNAHIVKELLENVGIPAHISGEFLQSGIGDLPAVGMIQVMVGDEHVEQARALLADWESAQPAFVDHGDYDDDDDAGQQPRNSTVANILSWFVPGLVGLLLGFVGTVYLARGTVSEDGIDYNRDGVLEERVTYAGDVLSKVEIDRNRDGKFDDLLTYDFHGLLKSEQSDNDFDGTFDTESRFSEGLLIWFKSDTTGDGFRNYVLHYTNGVPTTGMHIGPRSKLPVKVEFFDALGKLTHAELDTNGDGKLDTIHEYDDIGEIRSARPK